MHCQNSYLPRGLFVVIDAVIGYHSAPADYAGGNKCREGDNRRRRRDWVFRDLGGL